MNKITYHKEGDYLIPDLYLPKEPSGNIGKYGRLRLNYLKNFKKGLYTDLLFSNTLKQHLLDVEKDAKTRVDLLIKQFAENEHVDENLKAHHQMEWVQAMNSIKNRAEEIVFNEIIYV
ncbi:MAG: TnpV protein [Clostridia bacterium]|nr:TnpV protein [Clostridia bacterium]